MGKHLDEKGVSPVIGVILMVVVTVILAAVLSGFIFQQGERLRGKPTASIVAIDQPGTSQYLVMKHRGGDSLDWADLRLSVTEGADSPTSFEEPYSGDNILSTAQDETDTFVAGESVLIHGVSGGGSLVEDTVYHVVLRHEPSGAALLDVNVLVTSG